MEKSVFILDLYTQIDSDDINEELQIEAGDLRNPVTGDVYTAIFTLKELKKVGKYDVESEQEL